MLPVGRTWGCLERSSTGGRVPTLYIAPDGVSLQCSTQKSSVTMEYGSDISPKNMDAMKETTFTSLARKPAAAMLSHVLLNLVGNSNFGFVN